MVTIKDGWNYFHEDKAYAEELLRRLQDGIEMNSALGLSNILQERMVGDLSLIDFGSGPGHYYPVIKNTYLKGNIQYHGVDIVPSSIASGSSYFSDDPDVSFSLGSVLEPSGVYNGEEGVISANTLSHVPTIEPLLNFVSVTPSVKFFIFRMLVGAECIQTKKHLSQTNYDSMFEQNYQLNNIYSVDYMNSFLGSNWSLEVISDFNNTEHLANHRLPREDVDPFYSHRVSHERSGMVFKGDLYMPWRYVLGRRSL